MPPPAGVPLKSLPGCETSVPGPEGRFCLEMKVERSKRVLLVDDLEIVREILRRTLESAGYEVGTAKDGAEGIEKFQGTAWDVVITDRAMPNMDGEEMAAVIKG